MAKYHLNPTTGNPGLCRAVHACPFGETSEHYDSQAEARKAFELTQELGSLTPEALLKKLHLTPPSGEIALLALTGSRAYGLAREDSDYDLRAVYQAPTRQLLSLNQPPATIDRNEPDATLWELDHFVKLATRANPNVMEILWAPDANLGPVVGLPSQQFTLTHPTGQLLRDNRSLFLSRRVGISYGGYALSQLKKAQAGRGGSRGVKHLAREKFIRHLFRLFEQGIDLLETGEMDIRVKDPEALREKSQWELSKVEAEFSQLDQKMQAAVSHSPLPPEPDWDQINQLLIDVRLRQLSQG